MVGIDIGCHSVKIVQLEAGAGTVRPRVCRVVPHATRLDPLDPNQCLNEIERTLNRAWSSRSRWWPLPAACTLSMNLMTFRTIELPESENTPTSPQQWQEVFLAESEAGAGSWVVEGWPTQVEAPTRGSRAFATLGVDESFASAIAATLWRCGLDCQVLDGLPFAMARAVTGTSNVGPVAVIDWGESAMTLTVVNEGRPHFTRILRDCELRSLTSAMMRSLQLESEQCRQVLEGYGFGQSPGGPDTSEMSAMVAEISAPYLSRLAEELRRTWVFLQHLAGQTPTRVILMGGGATLKMSASIVRSSMPVPTVVWTMPQSSNSADRSGPTSAPFGPALALASLARNQ
jgi:Tfp pilus assembly PilM family ATPase